MFIFILNKNSVKCKNEHLSSTQTQPKLYNLYFEACGLHMCFTLGRTV